MRFTDRFQSYTRNLRARLGWAVEEDHTEDQLVSDIDPANEPDRAHSSSGYIELMSGSVPCPSCNGSGMIPKELEGTLVALIPLTDDRLKPKNTSTIFVMMPRTVTLSTMTSPIPVVHVTQTDPQASHMIDFDFLNRINVSSGNYLPVSIVNVSATIVSKFAPWSVDVVGYGVNSTISQDNQLVVYGKSVREVYLNNTVQLRGYVAEYCQAEMSNYTALYVTMQFDIAVTLQYYYGHQEKVMTTAQQPVCCIPRGNCTSP